MAAVVVAAVVPRHSYCECFVCDQCSMLRNAVGAVVRGAVVDGMDDSHCHYSP